MKHLKKKDLLLLANKRIEKMSDPRNAKEHYQSFIRRKNTKLVKQWKIITYLPKTFENPNIAAIKLIIEQPKTSHKLFKTIRQAEKVDSNSSSYSDAKKNVKLTKREHAFKGLQVQLLIMLRF